MCHKPGRSLSVIINITRFYFIELFRYSEYNFTSSRRIISSWSRSDVVPQLSVRCRDTVQSLHLSGDLLVCGLQNGEVQVWSLVRKCLDCLAGYHGTAVTAVALASLSSSPQQIIVLSGSWKQEVKLFSLSDSTQLSSVRLRRRLVRRIAVSGQTAAVASCDIEAGRAGEAAGSLGPLLWNY